MAVGATQRLTGHNVRMISRQVETHVKGFLVIARLARIQLLGSNSAVPCMADALGDIDLELLLQGQLEETLAGGQQFLDARFSDGVALDVEKSPSAARFVDLICNPFPGCPVILIERADINDWQCFHDEVSLF